jgi:hypothetical protein
VHAKNVVFTATKTESQIRRVFSASRQGLVQRLTNAYAVQIVQLPYPMDSKTFNKQTGMILASVLPMTALTCILIPQSRLSKAVSHRG